MCRNPVVDDDILQHVDVQRDVEGSGAHGGHLAEHDVLRDTVTIILLAHRSGLHKDLHGLLE